MMADMTRTDAKPTGASHTRASHMATPALTRKELLERLNIEFPEPGMHLGTMTLRRSSTAAVACVSATIRGSCDQAARFQAPR